MNTPAQPLPSIDTMVALCSEAREGVRRQIKRDPDFRHERWLQDREPCLYAIDAAGDRLNDGSWWPWKRRKRDVEQLLRDFPGAVSIVVDSGVNVAENKESLDAGDYTPVFWQVAIWKRDAPVYTEAQINEILRRRTYFRSFDDMFAASGRYRPSIDERDPEMKAIGDRYDQLADARNDARRAYRYGEAKQTAAAAAPQDAPASRQASKLKPGDVVLIGAVDEPEVLERRTVADVRVMFGLNVMLRFSDGTSHALRDDQEVRLLDEGMSDVAAGLCP